MEWIILFTVGVIGGTIGSLMGLGGGIIVVPALLYLGVLGVIGDITPQVAVGTSLLAIIATGLSSTMSYFKKKLVDVKSGLLFFIGSGPFPFPNGRFVRNGAKLIPPLQAICMHKL